MSWRDQLGTVTINGRFFIGASFRGVPLFVETAELEGGRRTVQHEYPNRDEVYHEDLGRAGRTFQVEGYVIGDGYLAARDALISALEEAGPGILLHPYYGRREVISKPFRVRESTDSGGMARFSITFEETGAAPAYPSVSPAIVDRAAASADAAETALGAGFEVVYITEDLPLLDLASLQAVIEGVGEALDTALSPVVDGTQELAALKRSLDVLVLDADSLVRTPWKVAGALNGILVSFADLPLRPSLALPALLAAYGFTPSVARPPSTTTTRVQEGKNYDALLLLVRSLILVETARLALSETFDSYDAAVAARDAICDRLDDQMATADDTSYAALEQLRADLVRAVPGEDSDLPRLTHVTPPVTVPSLVLAHRLYGSVALEGDLVTRNRIQRPGFIPGGVALEVLGA